MNISIYIIPYTLATASKLSFRQLNVEICVEYRIIFVIFLTVAVKCKIQNLEKVV
jgi:hypothetical protein